ncbi:MAG: hypothetical protein J5771_05095 [Bacteroidales bacterium]|nr:hypothetical protein [Bacteroidales bacterium]
MKTLFKYITTLAVGLFALACSPDPDVTIYDNLGFPKCLTPISFATDVKYTTITVRFTTFPDAEGYEFEVYTAEILPDEEPWPDDLIYSHIIPRDSIPYSFEAPDETYCYMRLRAFNNKENKEPSEWVYSNEKTDVDPNVTCPTPTDAKAKSLYRKVSFTWTGQPTVKDYVLEIYSENVVNKKDPDPQYLVATYSVPSSTVMPYVIMYPDPDEAGHQYWFRVRGTNDDRNLKPSRWVTGNYSTSHYYWNDGETEAFDYGMSSNQVKNANFQLLGTVDAQDNPIYLDADDKVQTGGVTLGGVTYGEKLMYDWNGFVYMNKCTQDNTTFTKVSPLDNYIKIGITRPGTFSFIPRVKSGVTTMPEVRVALLTLKANVQNFTYLYNERLVQTSTIYSKNEANRISVTVTEDDLYGANGMSSLYLFSTLTAGSKDLYIYPIRWQKQ